MNVRARRWLVAGLLALTLALAGCAEQSTGGEGGEPVTEVTVEGSEWKLTPGNVTVPAGEEVTVTFENVGSNQHNFGVDLDGDGDTEDDARTETIAQGETDTVTFTVDEPGEYTFFCDVPGHQDAGMEGTLTVQ